MGRVSVDMTKLRDDFPALRSGTAHFDSPGGTQTPQAVIDAVGHALAAPLANRGSANQAQRNAEEIVQQARAAVGDFANADPSGVVFGRSATELTFQFSRLLARRWSPGDEVVVTRLDHDANVRPWLIAAAEVGATVRWADFDPRTGELDPSVIANQLSDRTRLVALTAASNLIGTMPDTAAIADAVHNASAELYVDGVHYAAHARVDVTRLGADFFVCSPYKFFGPHLGVLIAQPDRLATLSPDKLLPATDAVPERFELGTLPYELLAGTTAAIDYLAGIGGAAGGRRDRLATSYRRLSAHETQLRTQLEDGLRTLGATLYSRAEQRTPTVLFDLDGQPAADVANHLARAGVNAPAGSFYAIETSRHLGLGDSGAVRAGIAPYSNADDVDRLLTALNRL